MGSATSQIVKQCCFEFFMEAYKQGRVTNAMMDANCMYGMRRVYGDIDGQPYYTIQNIEKRDSK